MGYCDSKKLEACWFNWIVSNSTPELEFYRIEGILWTKIIGTVVAKNGKKLPDPSHQTRWHYLDVGGGVYCQTHKGRIVQKFRATGRGTKGTQKVTRMPLEYSPIAQKYTIGMGVGKTANPPDGYFKEVPTRESWHKVLQDVALMCQGIAKKFALPSEEHREELSQAAFLQVTKKLHDGKLVYMPGRAPVFNLLTTTIYRCMFSELNKASKQQRNTQKIVDGVATGAICSKNRSLRCPIPQSSRQRAVTNR